MSQFGDRDRIVNRAANYTGMGLSGGFFPPRIGLVAGDAALLIVPLYNAVRLRTVLLTIHIGEANLALPNSKGIFLIYAIFSVIGWIFVDVPIVIALPERLLSRVPWLGCTFIGATLGPLALLIILLVLFAYQGRLSDSVSPTPKASDPSLS